MRMIKVKLKDQKGNTVEESVVPPEEAAEKVRQYVLLQGSDPDEKGKGATKGRIDFEPVEIEPPIEDSSFIRGFTHNFTQLLRAVRDKNVGLMQGHRMTDKVPLAVIVARSWDGKEYRAVPLGIMFAGNPYNMVIPNDRNIKEEPITLEEERRALLEEAESRVRSCREVMGLPMPVVPYLDDPFVMQLYKNAGKCPKCGSVEINAGNYDGLTTLSCDIMCDKCKFVWTEEYKFFNAFPKEDEDVDSEATRGSEDPPATGGKAPLDKPKTRRRRNDG